MAITRAKQHLSVHLNGDCLNEAAKGLAAITTDPQPYPAPESLCYLLTHRDLWLDYFISVYRQSAIDRLQSGMPLRITEEGCTDTSGNDVLHFSQKFKNTLRELKEKGYTPQEASVNFIVYWKKQGEQQEVKIVLPRIVVGRES